MEEVEAACRTSARPSSSEATASCSLPYEAAMRAARTPHLAPVRADSRPCSAPAWRRTLAARAVSASSAASSAPSSAGSEVPFPSRPRR